MQLIQHTYYFKYVVFTLKLNTSISGGLAGGPGAGLPADFFIGVPKLV